MSLRKLPTKEELAVTLANYPVLNSVLCLILYEGWFRVAMMAGVLLIPAILLLTLKVWTATPAGFKPVVKISGLDVLQAWSLRRTALSLGRQGKFDDALYSWRVAIANNPADPDLIRGAMQHLREHPDPGKFAPVVAGYSSWLLRLSRTNLSDLELSAQIFQQHRLDDQLIYLLAPLDKQLSPLLHSILLRALFNRGEISEFASRWETLERQGITLYDPESQLYRAAYLAGWGPPDGAVAARQSLARAAAQEALAPLTHRLQLKISEQLIQLDIYKSSLDYLQDHRLDTLADHIGHWQLLATVGRKPEAVKLIKAHVRPPSSGEEVVLLARAYFDLGFPDESREVLKHYSIEFPGSESLWLTYSNLLIEQKRWQDLFQLGLQLRHEAHPLRDFLNGYSYYLQGIAEAHLDRRENARQAFQRVAQTRLRNKVWELSAAETVASLGFPQVAQELLVDIQKEVPSTPEYWMLLARTAYETKDPKLLVSSLASAYRLRPDDHIIINNYAAALLSTRQRSEEALSLTTRVIQQQPAMPATYVNHALALVQNRRFAEAQTLLRELDPARLEASDLSSYYLAAFELSVHQQQFDAARQFAEKIEIHHLFPTERQWLEKTRQQIAAAAPAPATRF